jgi:tripartite-type tricarboxylate transporter receptor subunit TctC
MEENTMHRCFPAQLCALVAGLASASALAQAPAKAAGADFPTKPIRILVAFPPGASTDIIARLIAPKLTEAWGQNVIIENRGGAGGNIGAQVAARANNDGYTLLGTSVAFAVNVSLYANPGYAIKDFTPVIQAASTPNIFFVHPSVPANSLAELIALAKTKPMSYASSGTGTTTHLAMELLKTLAKIDIQHVPYSPATAVTAVVGGQVPIGSTSMPPAVPLIKGNRIRGLAVTSAKRSPALPEIPTVAEQGFPGFADYTWFAFFAPAGTPMPIVNKLNAEIQRALQAPDVKERLAGLSFDVSPNTAAEFAKTLNAEVAQYAKVVKASGAKAD